MRKMIFIPHWIVCILLAAIIVVFCAGCSQKKATYICDVNNSAAEEEESVFIADAERDTIIIGNYEYAVRYKGSWEAIDGRMLHEYAVVTEGEKESQSGENAPYIYLDENGILMSFGGISPLKVADNVESMSKWVIKATTEWLLKDIVDFSIYNRFEIDYYENSSIPHYLRWYVERGEVCDISLMLRVEKDGSISSFARRDYCERGFRKPFLSDEERDRLIMAALKEYHAQRTGGIEPYRVEIRSALLSCYGTNRLIQYAVTVFDEEGFCEVLLVRITEQTESTN